MKPVIFFDWDGTIVDSMELCVQEVLETMRRMGLPEPPVELCRACNGPSYEETVSMLGIHAHRAQEYFDVRHRASRELCQTVNKAYEGVSDMLRALAGKAELCVVSNGMKDYIEQCMALFDLDGLFLRIEGAVPGRSKTQALQQMLDDLQPERAIMVGDRLGDIRAGRNCGLPTVAACYGFGTEEEWKEATLQAKDMQELQRILEEFIA